MEYKKPLTVCEQIEYLKKNKRIAYIIDDKLTAKEVLYTNNYINVISPFKYIFAKKDNTGKPLKNNGCHVYPRTIDFSEYSQKYYAERSKYPLLYMAISNFETHFNAILSNEILCYYKIDSREQFDTFLDNLKENTSKYSFNKVPEKNNNIQKHMIAEINKFSDYIEKYNSPYIFMDRLSLSELVAVYKTCDIQLGNKVFSELLKRKMVLDYTRKTDFDNMLTLLIPIRNCIMHSNSITVLTRYYNIKDKELRSQSDKKRYENLISKLLSNA